MILAIAAQEQAELVTIPPSGYGTTGKYLLSGIPAYELDYSRDLKWIAYTSYPEHTLWRCHVDGSEKRQLTPVGLEAHQPHWSPDGTRIAFMGRPKGKKTHSRVYLVPSPGGGIYEPLPDGEDQGVPTWSADGKSIIYGDLRSISGFEGASIHSLNLETQERSAIAAPLGMWSPRMSPDGKYLVAVSFDSKGLYVQTTGPHVWRKCVSMDFLEEPSWPLDSSWIQFLGKSQTGHQAVFRVSPSCEQPKEIADLSHYIFAGDTWIGIALDHSPIGLVKAPPAVYALEWQLRRRIP
jgi:Tol biopolymer transport system component